MDHKFLIDSNEILITASLGVSLLNKTHVNNFEDFYTIADKALYRAKDKGKNRVEIIEV